MHRLDTRARPRRAQRAWSTRRRCSRATTRACGATWYRSPTRGTSRRPLRSPGACSRAATTWTAAASARRAGCRCWWLSCTTPRRRPPAPRSSPGMTTRSTSSTGRASRARRATAASPPTDRSTATGTTRWAVSRCACTTTGSWCRAPASAGAPTTSRATCGAATASCEPPSHHILHTPNTVAYLKSAVCR